MCQIVKACIEKVIYFLVADTQLYKRLCPSVGLSVRPSVRRSVGPLVREHESKSGKTSVLEAFCVCVCVGRRVGWGVGYVPTRPQQYCDPASLVP